MPTQNLMRKIGDDLYHRVLTISWKLFFWDIFVFYCLINLSFALIYFSIGPQGFSVNHAERDAVFFADCFFFSVQTFSTIGYGVIAPKSFLANVVVALQALTGMLSIGLISGLFFSRFSRPTAKVVYSDFIVITKYMGKRCILFRAANSRSNRILDAKIGMTCLMEVSTPEGHSANQLFDLPLRRSNTPFFGLSFLAVHEIDPSSALYHLSEDDFKTKFQNRDLRIIATVSGHDDTFNQTIFSRKFYEFKDIVFDRFFADMLYDTPEGDTKVDLSKISVLK